MTRYLDNASPSLVLAMHACTCVCIGGRTHAMYRAISSSSHVLTMSAAVSAYNDKHTYILPMYVCITLYIHVNVCTMSAAVSAYNECAIESRLQSATRSYVCMYCLQYIQYIQYIHTYERMYDASSRQRLQRMHVNDSLSWEAARALGA